MIRGNLQRKRCQPNLLVENKNSFAGPESELSIYDTFEQASRVALKSDQLLFCGMVTGKKVMHSEQDFEAAFYPHESFIMAPNQTVEIDFPEAQIHKPTTCLAIEISTDRIQQVADRLNIDSPIQQDYGHWQYQQALVHTHHTQQTQALLDRMVGIYTENEQDRSCLIDLAVSELIVRLLRHQTRDFLLQHSDNNPEFNGLNAALQYISLHLNEPLDINELCRRACMSRSKFFQQFKAHLGCSPAAFQQQVRLKKAATLIEQGQQITQVCFSLGYSSTSHFSRLFKAFFGLCPSDYKQRHLHS
ncbi:AraC family transcriptional regulator [Shewanella olleyana]|uniref:AraC family transcriptional regulator n=1 Tax=Shewanella olleyana TaxID=135626 RepID=UPI00200DF52E|nr:AraC family transcriptional regulator [Shewanella olleyana]MCL1067819.1 AraC family transcriptional regulator [Shewanella olleyana]